MLPTSLPLQVPGGPELVIIVMMLFLLVVPITLFAGGVLLGWGLRGRGGESADGTGSTDRTHVTDEAEPIDDTATREDDETVN